MPDTNGGRELGVICAVGRMRLVVAINSWKIAALPRPSAPLCMLESICRLLVLCRACESESEVVVGALD